MPAGGGVEQLQHGGGRLLAIGPQRRHQGLERPRVEERAEERGGRLGCRLERLAHHAAELGHLVHPLLDQQELPHLEGEAEHGLEVRAPGRVQQLGHRPHRLPRHGLLGLFRSQPLQQLRPHRPVPQGHGLREGRERQVPLRRGVVALGGAAEQVADRGLRELLLGDESLDGGDRDVVEGGLAQQGDEVVLLLPDPGVADGEDLEEAQHLLPRHAGLEADPAHPVAEEPEGQRALAVLLEVDDLAAEDELEGVDLQHERAEGRRGPSGACRGSRRSGCARPCWRGRRA